MIGIRAVFVGGPAAGRVQDFPTRPEVIEIQGIDFREGIPLPDQRVVSETGVYERTYAERTVDGVVGWRYEWRGWRGIPDT